MSKARINPWSVEATVIPSTTRDIRDDVLDADGRPRVLPAEWWRARSSAERALFGNLTGVYGFPTVELVAALRDRIGDRSAIEIGSGCGVLADALGITGTDSFLQERPDVRREYYEYGQEPVRYGPNVVQLDAARAVARLRPQVVVACWVTHKYNKRAAWLDGNRFGVDEAALLADVEEYILVGNLNVHKRRPIWAQAESVEHPDYVFSRARDHRQDFVAVWRGGRAGATIQP